MTARVTSGEVVVFSESYTLLLLLLTAACSLSLERLAAPDQSWDERSVALTVANVQRVHVKYLRIDAHTTI